MTAQTIDLEELARRAFMAGFCASCEGYNGEYPFNDDVGGVIRELEGPFQLFWNESSGKTPVTPAVEGISLRDWFAGQALAGIASMSGDDFSLSPEDEAAWAYQRADAMLAAREVQS